MKTPYLPREMSTAVRLGDIVPGRTVRRRYAPLLNPFYRKDPYASYGKHVRTPTLALTSIAGATPDDWEVRYWDENLLLTPPPAQGIRARRGRCSGFITRQGRLRTPGFRVPGALIFASHGFMLFRPHRQAA